MAKQNDEFLKRLLATFHVEADEHLSAMSSGLLELEKAPADGRTAEIVEKVFREAHSLKGATRAVNLKDAESVCQSLESVFAAVKNQRLAVSPALSDLLYQAIDTLGGLVAPATAAPASHQPDIALLIRRLDDALQGGPITADVSPAPQPEPAAPVPAMAPSDQPPKQASAAPENNRNDGIEAALNPTVLPPPTAVAGTVRVPTAKLDAVMRQAEELLAPRLAAAQRTVELHEAASVLAARKKELERMKPALRLIERVGKDECGLRELPKLIEYLDSEPLFLKTLEDRLARLIRAGEHDRRALAGMADNLLRDVKEMHLLPFVSLLESFPRFVRDLARDQGKAVAFTIQGDEIEIDRRILEQMKDPLIHLLRNCLDHGIEHSATRREKGKPPQGSILLAIMQKDSGKVEILVEDDGAGIDTAKVRQSARKLGLVSADEAEALEEDEALTLIFQSGVTTSPIITDISGRGLGLAIMREKVERLGGSVALESHPGSGASFRIALPLALANFQGVLLRTGEQVFAVPTAHIERVMRVPVEDIRTVENRETIVLDGQAVSLVRLNEVLELPPGPAIAGLSHAAVAVLRLGTLRIAFRVDEVLGEQEVLVKALGPQLARVRNVGGACVLGTGQVVAVLNVADLLKSAVRRPVASRADIAAEESAEVEKPSILVVEDSITSRSLLKNILESAGYRVATAVDGVDAYTALKTASFDLMVSDVEMPRMDGFDLTAKVRADAQLKELPIVLVTVLESREHRERGVDAGANAYIVKSSFDQSNLLEVVRRFV